MKKQSRRISIYVLKCQNDKYYVGQSTNIKRRFLNHQSGLNAAEWTKIFKPVELVEVVLTPLENRIEAVQIENEVTVRYMLQYGWENVRGGDFCVLDPFKLRVLLAKNTKLGTEILPIDSKRVANIRRGAHYVFCLKLARGNYFVGTTTQIYLAILGEFSGQGSQWTRMYKPLELVEATELPEDTSLSPKKIANLMVQSYMGKYGYQKVRGGDFYQIDPRSHKYKVMGNTDYFLRYDLRMK